MNIKYLRKHQIRYRAQCQLTCYLRKGELEAVSVSKRCDRAVFKMKGRPTLFVPLKEVDVATATATGNLHDGLGQSRNGIFGNGWWN